MLFDFDWCSFDYTINCIIIFYELSLNESIYNANVKTYVDNSFSVQIIYYLKPKTACIKYLPWSQDDWSLRRTLTAVFGLCQQMTAFPRGCQDRKEAPASPGSRDPPPVCLLPSGTLWSPECFRAGCGSGLLRHCFWSLISNVQLWWQCDQWL